MSKRENSSASNISRERPAITVEAREDQIIAAAMDLAEQRILDGTASNQLLCHFVKLGSTKERLEKEILAEQKKLVSAKTESLQTQKRIDEMYAEVIDAMKLYSGVRTEEDEDEY